MTGLSLESDRNEGEGAGQALFDDGGVGVYLHLPYCERICPYCDFAVLAARPLSPEVEAAYVDDLLRELTLRAGAFEGRFLASLYLGGGTPSLFHPTSIERLVCAVRAAFGSGRGKEVEITLEVNPSTTECTALPAFRAAGVNRLSIGVQSFRDAQLKRLGRAHCGEVARETLRSARASGFDNLSVDLIFSAPEQTLADLDQDLDEVIAFGPEHVSTYELTFEPQTPFGQALATGRLKETDEDLAVEMIERIQARLEGAGLERYEISSYARPGRRAQHNARYWKRLPVLGLGMGAHSTEVRSPGSPFGARSANPRTLDPWREAVRSDRRAGTLELIGEETARGEALFLGLRQREGCSARRFEAEFGKPPRHFYASQIDGFVERGWLEENRPEPGDLRLSSGGRLLADTVAAAFVADSPESN